MRRPRPILFTIRGLLVIALALVLAGSAAAGSAGSKSGGLFSMGGFEGPTGGLFLGDDHWPNMQFIPRQKFAVGFQLENTSQTTLVLTGAAAIEPPRSLIHQIGTQFHPFSPPTCAPFGGCPPVGPPLNAKAAHPHPFTVHAGKWVGVELDFRLGSCADVPGANPGRIWRVRLTVRVPGGPAQSRVLKVSPFALRRPKPEDCTFPRSRLNIEGPGQYPSSWYFTYSGSTGDVCTLRQGALSFTGRAYMNSSFRAERVEIVLPHFTGKGIYHRAIARVVLGGTKLVAGRKTGFRLKGTLVVVRATRSKVVGTIDAGKPPPLSGTPVPFHIWGTMRCRVVR